MSDARTFGRGDGVTLLNMQSYADFRAVWTKLNRLERTAVQEKAQREGMTPWAVLREWPSLIPRRFRDPAT